jgi:hypothetical protein
MQYMLLIYGDPATAPDPASPEAQARHGEWATYSQTMAEAGLIRSGAALQPVETATTVRGTDAETLTVDGPFAETKEVLGGFYVLDVPDLDTALAWAAKAPHLAHGSVEVRPVMELD